MRSALRFVPVVADADVDGQRRVERIGAAHLLADEIAHGRSLHLGDLEQELVVHLEDEPGGAALLTQRRWIATMAALITSAAVPCMTKLTASRSPNPRVCRLRAFSSGTGRRRPKSVVAYPSSSACSIVRWMKSWTCGKRARYVSM